MKHRPVPGFHLHRSNRLESLAGTLVGLMRAPMASALAEDIVVVQSQGMARWLKLEIASKLGVAAHIRFPFPRAFAHELFRALGLTVDQRPSFDPELLVWRIFQILPEATTLPGFGSVKRYLADGDDRKRFQLAGRLARLFDQYLVYRPDLIEAWDADDADWVEKFGADAADAWQARLWFLVGQGWASGHPAAWHREFLRRAQDGTLPKTKLPERVFVFGVSSLPPFHLDLLAALGKVADVHLFLLQPTEHYWGDVKSRREQALLRRGSALNPFDPAHEEGHRLVASLGRTGREMLDLLLDRDAHDEAEHFEAPSSETLLDRLQQAMLGLQQRVPGEPRTALGSVDGSLRVHSCHSPMREVEVLRDHLLAWFDEDRSLQPRDVVVMVPDLETYAPLLDAVLALPEKTEQFIPYSIANRSPRAGQVGAALWQALELVGGMFGAAEVLGLLEREPVRKRFGLEADDIETCRGWIRDAEIRWGRDPVHAAKHKADGGNTWRSGLARLLMSYAMVGSDEVIACGVASSVDVDGSDADVLGGFCQFVETLLRFVDEAEKPAPPVEWAQRLDRLFANIVEAEAVEAEAVKVAITSLRDAGQWAGCHEPISLQVVMEHLGGALAEDRRGRGFLHGGVTICGLKPMRSVPFKVVCLLGMNHGVFPRQSSPLAFDLTAKRRRAGDSSPRDDDRHLFLETIISARQRIHISHVGQSQRDGKAIPPSVVVSELLDHLDHEFELSDGKPVSDELVVKHRLQAFSPEYFAGGRLFSYSKANHAAAVAQIAQRIQPPPALTGNAQPLQEPETIDLAELIRFFRNPARHFAERRLAFRFNRAEDALPEEERFSVDRRENHSLVEVGVAALRSGKPLAAVLEFQGAAGRLPGGALLGGERSRLSREAEGFWSRCREYFNQPTRRVFGEVASASGLVVSGSVEVFGDSVVMARYSKLESRPDLLLAAWLELLFAAALDGAVKRAVVLGRDETVVLLHPDNVSGILEELLRLHLVGQRSVLSFACKASFAYAQKMEGKVRDESQRERLCIAAARGAWNPSAANADAPPGEAEDEAMQLAFAGVDLPALPEFADISLKIFKPLLQHREGGQ